MTGIVVVILGLLGLGTGATVFIIRNLYYVCQPSEVLIFAGGTRSVGDGRQVGYRLVKGGSSLRTPLIERALRMDLTNMIIELRVSNAYSKGGIPLAVEGVANIKIAGEEPTIHNAIERLLGKSRKEIEAIAKETLEGNLRGVLASLTPEQVNEDKMAFAKSLLEEAEDDLECMGLVLDTLQIQNISDDVRYLDSIGRKQSADLLRDARIAEAQARAESAIKTADNGRKTALRRLDRDIAIARAEAERRIQDATTRREALIAESEAEIASEVARTQAEVPVQKERIKQAEQQLQADVVAPAEAECKRAIARAQGDAASIIEDGKAQAEGTRQLAESWKNAGTHAREIFLLQKLEILLKTLGSTIPAVEVQNVTVIDSDNGSTAAKLAGFNEQLRYSTGIDLGRTVQHLTQSESPLQPPSNLRSQQPGDSAFPPNASMGFSLPSTSERTRPTPSRTNTPRVPLSSSTPVSIPKIDAHTKTRVQEVLNQIAADHMSSYQAEQAIHQVIQNNDRLKRQLRRALAAGGDAAIKMIFEHPLVHIPTKMVEAWLAESDR
jgi:flotillin